MLIKFKKLSENAVMPKKGREGDACFDLYAAEDAYLVPGETKIIKTNIAMEIPTGYFGKIYTRSGMASQGAATDGGVIDSNYRGDIGVILRNLSNERKEFFVGDRIAQLAIHKVEEVELVEATELSDTERGEGGYGSSGV
jgi:dUTP pyrophosphatase